MCQASMNSENNIASKYDISKWLDEAGEFVSDFDGFWKDVIEEYWREVLERFLPDLYAEADLSGTPEFLDKELRDVLGLPETDSHNSPLFVDELVKVPMKDGDEKWLLLHIEVQGKGGADISYRMFLYYCMLFAHYRKNIVSLAILTARRPKKEKALGIYETDYFGTLVKYRYNFFEAYKFSDEELETSGNKIDLFLLAVKFAVRSKNNESKKFAYLKRIVRILFKHGFNEFERRGILRYVNYIVGLRDNVLRRQYHSYITEIEEGKGMRDRPDFLAVIEYECARDKGIELGIKRGIEQGVKQGIEQGVKQGIEQGIKQGVKQGIEQGMRQGRDFAQDLLSSGILSNEQIAEVLRLYPQFFETKV